MKPTRRRVSMSPPLTALAEQPGLALGRRQQAGQHLHGRGLAAAVRAEEAEDLAALDAEVDMVDGDEVAEPLGQAWPRWPASPSSRRARRDDAPARWPRALSSGSSAMKAFSSVARAGARLQLARACRSPSTLAGVHRHQPVEALGLVHVGGRDHHAHAGPARADAVDQLPELAARQRIDAGRRLVEDQQIRVVDQRAAEAELLLHAAGELAGRPVAEGRQVGGRRAARRCAARALRATGRTAGRRSRCSRRSTASDRGSCPGPAACRRCGRDRVRKRARRRCRRPAPRRRRSGSRARRRRARAASTCRRRPGRSGRPCSPAGMSRSTSSSASVFP